MGPSRNKMVQLHNWIKIINDEQNCCRAPTRLTLLKPCVAISHCIIKKGWTSTLTIMTNKWVKNL